MVLGSVEDKKENSQRGDGYISRIAFASCFNPSRYAKNVLRGETIWTSIADTSPELFIWTGDATYTSSSDGPRHSIEALRNAFNYTRGTPGYRHLIEDVLPRKPIGIYDDHDFGVNDGGGGGGILDFGVVDRDARKEAFLDFLDEPEESARRTQPGAYAAYTFGVAPRKIKVILLDTRYFRSAHAIPSVGAMYPRAKVMPILAAFSRWISSAAGLTSAHKGKMLGEVQWLWLEAQLRRSDASVHLIVSSVQVFTSNPLFESWGHFPYERQRLVQLLKKHRIDSKGILFLSGDVHAGEVLRSKEPSRHAVEITSSGLTHGCTDGGIPGPVCRAVWSSFGSHDYYLGRNFGTVDIDWTATQPVLTSRIHDEYGNTVLSLSRGVDETIALDYTNMCGMRQLALIAVHALCIVCTFAYVSKVIHRNMILFYESIMIRSARRQNK